MSNHKTSGSKENLEKKDGNIKQEITSDPYEDIIINELGGEKIA